MDVVLQVIVKDVMFKVGSSVQAVSSVLAKKLYH